MIMEKRIRCPFCRRYLDRVMVSKKENGTTEIKYECETCGSMAVFATSEDKLIYDMDVAYKMAT